MALPKEIANIPVEKWNFGLRKKILSKAYLIPIFLQGAACPDPTMVFVDLRALRNDRVTLVEKGSPHSLCLMESGKVRYGWT